MATIEAAPSALELRSALISARQALNRAEEELLEVKDNSLIKGTFVQLFFFL